MATIYHTANSEIALSSILDVGKNLDREEFAAGLASCMFR